MFGINSGDVYGRLDLKLAGAESGYGFADEVHHRHWSARPTGP